MIDLFKFSGLHFEYIVEILGSKNSSRTKPRTSSVMFLPQTDDCSWRAIVATPTSLCSRMRAATIRERLKLTNESARFK